MKSYAQHGFNRRPRENLRIETQNLSCHEFLNAQSQDGRWAKSDFVDVELLVFAPSIFCPSPAKAFSLQTPLASPLFELMRRRYFSTTCSVKPQLARFWRFACAFVYTEFYRVGTLEFDLLLLEGSQGSREMVLQSATCIMINNVELSGHGQNEA